MKAGIINTGVSLEDRDYQIEHNSISIASIRISPDGFSYALFDTLKNKYVKLESFDLQRINNDKKWIETIGILINEKNIAPRQYIKTYIQSCFSGTLLIPKNIYDTDKKDLYFKYNHYPDSKQKILEDKIPILEAVMLHPISVKIETFINTTFPKVTLRHQSSAILHILKKQYVTTDHEFQIFVQVDKETFDIIVFKHGSLLFFNTFQFKTVEDFLYFLLYSFQQLDLNPDEIEVSFLGNLTSSAPLVQKASKYIRYIKFLKKNPHDDFSNIFREIEDHQYFNLFNLKNCE